MNLKVRADRLAVTFEKRHRVGDRPRFLAHSTGKMKWPFTGRSNMGGWVLSE